LMLCSGPAALRRLWGYLTLCGLLLVLNAAPEEWTYGVNGTVFNDLVYPRYLCDVLWHMGVGSCSLYFF